jgi:serine phosphatase RsbU (regulator of sigma subunit)
MGHFIAFTEGDALRRVPIGPGGVTIGRQAPCDVVIPSPEISRRHCRIALEGDWAVLSDLGSTNGTFVGGERVAEPVRLHNGSPIALGTVALRYERRDERQLLEEGQLAEELRRAVDYVRAILPPPIATGPVQTEWWFVPSSQLGGDAFGYQYLDDAHFAGFLLDVSGHGIGSAMHATNVANALRRRTLPGVDFRDPAQVAAGINAVFPMDEHNGLLLTLWYFVYHLPSRRLRFCAAGHHAAFLVPPTDPLPLALSVRGPTIGMLPVGKWAVGEADMAHGARIYVFSDGAFEIVTAGGEEWELENLRQLILQPARAGQSEPQRLYQAVRLAARPGPLDDDFSMLVVRFE